MSKPHPEDAMFFFKAKDMETQDKIIKLKVWNVPPCMWPPEYWNWPEDVKTAWRENNNIYLQTIVFKYDPFYDR